MKKYILCVPAAAMLLTGCWGSRYISADPSLEDIYAGRSYYDVVNDFGRPDATQSDGMEGTVAVYNSVNLSSSAAADLYRQHEVRNRVTKENGAPNGSIAFSFDTRMRCYGVDSDFEMKREKAAKPAAPKPVDRSIPAWGQPRIPRTLDFPAVERRSPYADVISIERIVMEKDSTVVHFMFKARTPDHRPVIDSGICVMQDIFIQDCSNGRRYKMLSVDGISLYPTYTRFAHNEGGYDVLVYSVAFDPMPAETQFIDIVEPGHSGYNFYGVDVRTPSALLEYEKNK